jgi:hypothetical protein
MQSVTLQDSYRAILTSMPLVRDLCMCFRARVHATCCAMCIRADTGITMRTENFRDVTGGTGIFKNATGVGADVVLNTGGIFFFPKASEVMMNQCTCVCSAL